jgi:hypothetical protein
MNRIIKSHDPVSPFLMIDRDPFLSGARYGYPGLANFTLCVQEIIGKSIRWVVDLIYLIGWSNH